MRKKVSDLVVKVKYDGRDVFFLILVEHQGRRETGFPKRFFYYFARLSEKYELDVYPVVVYSHDEPLIPEPSAYAVSFPGKKVLTFEYDVLQLNRMPWRTFVKQPNPAATALMAKMSIAPRDRPKVKAECLRLLATLRLDADKTELIYTFVENYLKLSAEEDRIYRETLADFGAEVKETAMEIMSSHRREGIHDGKEELVMMQLMRRFTNLPQNTTERLDRLTSSQLNDLGLALFDFQSISDLDAWLSQNPPN